MGKYQPSKIEKHWPPYAKATDGKLSYQPKKIERYWQQYWSEKGIFKVDEKDKKPKFYALDMFPYPSGLGLHVGHPKGYIATDVVARYKMQCGYNVLHPMGFDSFGLPAENYAIKNKIHPCVAVDKNIKRYKDQLEMFGFTYDWDREIITSDPEYYKWTQWIFLQMFNKGLAYQSNEPINWCPSCKTGLANEDLEDGKCERCGSTIEKRQMRQWVLKITDYAERLLDDLKLVDWEDSIIEMQKNWIGRSEGSLIKFQITNDKFQIKSKAQMTNSKQYIEVFTTRPDTLFGVTFMVICPEHKLITNNQDTITNYKEIINYVDKTKNKSELERTDLAKDKIGVEIKGIKAINPANNAEIPIFVADYVLPNYGTGAIMAVPAHDDRDNEFAKKYNLPIKQVIVQNKHAKSDDKVKVYVGDGILINSSKFSGLNSKKAKNEITKFVNGKKTVQYKLKDWVFSRQRYWGEPFPIVFCEECKKRLENSKCQTSNPKQNPNYKFKIQNIDYSTGEILNPGWIGVSEDQLPVKLPDVKSYQPTGTGESPLANIKDWVNTTCPKCGGPAKRETNTMPQWAGSSWYYLRYCDPKNDKQLANSDKLKYWMEPKGVDLYVGGAEHATRHLIYARFWHKFLYDIGIVTTKEPFYHLKHVGLINGEDGRKMSKRWGNVINPDDVIEKFGADALRCYEMFMGPFADSIAWSTQGVKGVYRFLDKLYNLSRKFQITNDKYQINAKYQNPNYKSNNILINQTIKKVTEDIEDFRFNTAISALMILVNEMSKDINQFSSSDFCIFTLLLSPFAPHLAENLWNKFGYKESILKTKWPIYDKNKIQSDIITLPVQINGKIRAKIEVESEITQEQLEKIILKEKNVKNYLNNKKIKKIIYVSGKILSIVI